MKTALILVFAAGAASADPVIWDNMSGLNYVSGLSSQYDTAYPFDSQLADDFMFTDVGYNVTDVEWVGAFWNPGDPGFDIGFNIYFYADDGSGSAPTTPVPGSALATYNLAAGDVAQTFNGSIWEYSADLPTPFTANVGQKYWVAIQAAMDFPPQWGWGVDNAIMYGANAKQGFPLLGLPYWTNPGYGDAMFTLSGTAIPAPASIALLGLGALLRRRR